MIDYLRQYLQYIVNTGGSPTVAMFDDDWEPAGPMLRRDLATHGLVNVTNGVMTLTDAGKVALKP